MASADGHLQFAAATAGGPSFPDRKRTSRSATRANGHFFLKNWKSQFAEDVEIVRQKPSVTLSGAVAWVRNNSDFQISSIRSGSRPMSCGAARATIDRWHLSKSASKQIRHVLLLCEDR